MLPFGSQGCLDQFPTREAPPTGPEVLPGGVVGPRPRPDFRPCVSSRVLHRLPRAVVVREPYSGAHAERVGPARVSRPLGGRRGAARRRHRAHPAHHRRRRRSPGQLLRAGLGRVEVLPLLRALPSPVRQGRPPLHAPRLCGPGGTRRHGRRRVHRHRTLRPHRRRRHARHGPRRRGRGRLPGPGRPSGARRCLRPARTHRGRRPRARHPALRRRGAARQRQDDQGVHRRRVHPEAQLRGRRRTPGVRPGAHRPLARRAVRARTACRVTVRAAPAHPRLRRCGGRRTRPGRCGPQRARQHQGLRLHRPPVRRQQGVPRGPEGARRHPRPPLGA